MYIAFFAATPRKMPMPQPAGQRLESNAPKAMEIVVSYIYLDSVFLHPHAQWKIHNLRISDSCWWNMMKCDKFWWNTIHFQSEWQRSFESEIVFSQDLYKRRPAVDNVMMLMMVVIMIMMRRRTTKATTPTSTKMMTMTKIMVIMMTLVMMKMIRNKLVMRLTIWWRDHACYERVWTRQDARPFTLPGLSYHPSPSASKHTHLSGMDGQRPLTCAWQQCARRNWDGTRAYWCGRALGAWSAAVMNRYKAEDSRWHKTIKPYKTHRWSSVAAMSFGLGQFRLILLSDSLGCRAHLIYCKFLGKCAVRSQEYMIIIHRQPIWMVGCFQRCSACLTVRHHYVGSRWQDCTLCSPSLDVFPIGFLIGFGHLWKV